ncbi:MAG: hypothetical protein ACRYGG_21995, partial [Janthinobacterium lividum]
MDFGNEHSLFDTLTTFDGALEATEDNMLNQPETIGKSEQPSSNSELSQISGSQSQNDESNTESHGNLGRPELAGTVEATAENATDTTATDTWAHANGDDHILDTNIHGNPTTYHHSHPFDGSQATFAHSNYLQPGSSGIEETSRIANRVSFADPNYDEQGQFCSTQYPTGANQAAFSHITSESQGIEQPADGTDGEGLAMTHASEPYEQQDHQPYHQGNSYGHSSGPGHVSFTDSSFAVPQNSAFGTPFAVDNLEPPNYPQLPPGRYRPDSYLSRELNSAYPYLSHNRENTSLSDHKELRIERNPYGPNLDTQTSQVLPPHFPILGSHMAGTDFQPKFSQSEYPLPTMEPRTKTSFFDNSMLQGPAAPFHGVGDDSTGTRMNPDADDKSEDGEGDMEDESVNTMQLPQAPPPNPAVRRLQFGSLEKARQEIYGTAKQNMRRNTDPDYPHTEKQKQMVAQMILNSLYDVDSPEDNP